MRNLLLIVAAVAFLAACTGFGDDPADTAPSSVQTKYGTDSGSGEP